MYADASTSFIDPGLLNHINHRLNDHESLNAIRGSLLEAGWERGQIEKAVKEVKAARKNTDRDHKGHPGIFMLNPHLDESRMNTSALEGRLAVTHYLVGIAFVLLFDALTVTPLAWGYYVLPSTPAINTLFFTVSLGIVLITIFSLISISVRRLHDLGYDNTWALFLFVPGLNLLFLGLLCAPGERGENAYGIDPHNLDLIGNLFNR